MIVIRELSHRGPRIAGFHRGRPAIRKAEATRFPTPPSALRDDRAQAPARFEGGNALPAFRAQALLGRLRGAVERIDRVAARHVHWVWSDAPLTKAETRPARGAAALRRSGGGGAGAETIVVAPRLGTVSPWASKATDIARNCGLAVHRVERVTEYAIGAQEAACSAAPRRSPPTSAPPSPRCCTTA